MPGEKLNIDLSKFSPVSLEEMDSVGLMNRFDTKFMFSVSRLPEFLELLVSDYKILEIGGDRAFPYSTMYLDTNGFMFFKQHITGRLERHKVRYRRYNSTGVSFLEVKRKTNKNKTVKWRMQNEYNPLSMNESASTFVNKYIGKNHSGLVPVLENGFNRITLVGFSTHERITIDYDLTFRSYNEKTLKFPYLAIVELKSESFACRSPFKAAISKSSVRMPGFSKYCVGSAMLVDNLRKNTLKEKILQINKIENEYSKCPLT
jgi:hypothetical protein